MERREIEDSIFEMKTGVRMILERFSVCAHRLRAALDVEAMAEGEMFLGLLSDCSGIIARKSLVWRMPEHVRCSAHRL